MSRRINLGGRHNSLCVRIDKDKYYFDNRSYSMMLTLYKEDVAEYMGNPNRKYWGSYSSSNSVADEDKEVIIDYLMRKQRKYKSVTDLLNSRSRKKEKILREDFSLNELVEYKIGKEKANG